MANSTVRPAAVSSRMDAQNRRLAATSIAAVGSSRTSSSGSGTSASAKRTRWVCPPDSAVVRRSARSVRSARTSTSSTGIGAG